MDTLNEDINDFLSRYPDAKRLKLTHQGNQWTMTPLHIAFDLRQRAHDCAMKVIEGSGYIAIAQYDIKNDTMNYLVDRV